MSSSIGALEQQPEGIVKDKLGAAVSSPATTADITSPEYLAARRSFQDFLDEAGEGKAQGYRTQVADLVARGSGGRLVVDLADIRKFSPDLAVGLVEAPLQTFPPLEDALNQAAKLQASKEQDCDYRVGLHGNLGARQVTPRQLLSGQLGKMVCVEGIITRAGAIRPKIVTSVHYCEETGQFSQHSYRDATSFVGQTTGAAHPTKDDAGNPLVTEFGMCKYKNHQVVTIQEMPERAPKGELPCSVDVILDDDLVDACKPGDRVQCYGVYRALAPSSAGYDANYRTLVIGNNLIPHKGAQTQHKGISGAEIAEIRKIAKSQDHLELLARSLAPSIWGHDFIKQALVLQLFGGAEHNLATGTHIRGDINILFVGDPSTAKSQLLRAMLNAAPLAISTTGRGSSGVGLTAAVVQDKDSGERTLEAGAMVLADRGLVCIDEFDKMSEADRVAIHEVMEQQTVTIAKAGIHTSLNARCSVVAAANPVYGQYDDTQRVEKNIGLPDSLLSRFDLLFIVLDHLDPELDMHIADHVIRLHRFPKTLLSQELDDSHDEEEEGRDQQPYQKYNKLLHGPTPVDLLTPAFLQKYIAFAKQRRVTPKLSDEAVDIIAEEYVQLRTAEGSRTLPITARLLETLIRLSTAHAKSRLGATVEKEDCDVALRILKFALYNDTQTRDADADPDAMVTVEEQEVKPVRSKRPRRSTPENEEEAPAPTAEEQPKRARTESGRFEDFRTQMVKMQIRTRRDQFEVLEVVDFINKVTKMGAYTKDEVEEYLVRLQDLDILMYREGVVTMIAY